MADLPSAPYFDTWQLHLLFEALTHPAAPEGANVGLNRLRSLQRACLRAGAWIPTPQIGHG